MEFDADNRTDHKLLSQALDSNWEIPPEVRAGVISKVLRAIALLPDNANPRHLATLVSTFDKLDKTNQRNLHKMIDKRFPDKVSIVQDKASPADIARQILTEESGYLEFARQRAMESDAQPRSDGEGNDTGLQIRPTYPVSGPEANESSIGSN